MMPADNASQQSLTVALRVRPINMLEVGQGARYIAHVVDKNLVVLQDPCDTADDILRQNRSREKEYLFDCALGPQTSQAEVYEATTKCLIDSVLTGYNATVFAYGPTGTGKTYTMLGTDSDPGIMVLTLNDLFKQMQQDQNVMNYRATMAYLEVYNEMICDLLRPNSGFLDLREDSKGNVVVAGLHEVETSSTTEVMRLLKMGNERRSCEPTAVNMTSSRSHAVLQVTVEASRLATVGAQQTVQIGRLYMVDLAGSERAAQTQNRGRRMVEGAHINRSLLALGNCINALVSGNKNHYINYRDSKLTRLLKEALGGNCHTVMIAHVSPASTSFEESRNTLGYADRAKHIKTKVRQNTTDVNYHILQYTAVIADLQEEITRLRRKSHEPDNYLNIPPGDNRSMAEFSQISGELKDILKKQSSLRQELQSKDELLFQNSTDIQRHKSIEVDRSDSRNTESHFSLNDAANTTSSTEVTLLSTNRVKTSHSRDMVGGSISPDNGGITMLNIPGTSGWCSEDVVQELSLLYGERELLHEQQKNILDRLEKAQSRAVDLKDRLAEYITTDSQHEIFDYLTKINELESDNIQQVRSMSHVRNGVLQVRQVMEQLVHQNRQCMELIEKQRSLIRDHFSECLLSVEEQYKQLIEQQQLLSIRLSSTHLQLHPLMDNGKHHYGNKQAIGDSKARLIDADSHCEESMPQLPVLPVATNGSNSPQLLKKMDTVSSLPSLDAKSSQPDEAMVRSHSELCLQNGSGATVKTSTTLPQVASSNSGGIVTLGHQQQRESSKTTKPNLVPVRVANGKKLNTTKSFLDSPLPVLETANSPSQIPHISKGRPHIVTEPKRGGGDSKVPVSMRKKLLNNKTRKNVMSITKTFTGNTSLKPVGYKTHVAKKEHKKFPLHTKETKDFNNPQVVQGAGLSNNLEGHQRLQAETLPQVTHHRTRSIPNGASRLQKPGNKLLTITGTGFSINKT